MPARRFGISSEKRVDPRWLLASVAVHIVLIVILVAVTRSVPRQQTTLIILEAPGALGPREFLLPSPGDVGGGGRRARSGRAAVVAPVATPDSIPSEFEAEVVAVAGADDSAAAGRPIGTRRRLGPAYGDGRLWVRGLEAQLGVVGPSGDIATHVARVDSAIRARLKAFIDTMPRDSFAVPPPPSWTIESDEQTWGMDPQWIYLGNIKIPTALLALLPFPQGSYYQAKDAAELGRMREDIMQAARRAETAEQFREYVNELRRRKDAEREERHKAKRDSVIP